MEIVVDALALIFVLVVVYYVVERYLEKRRGKSGGAVRDRSEKSKR